MTNIPNESSLRDKIRGCLLGVAIGDALGAPFEHLLPGETNQAIEKSGGRITDFHPYWTLPRRRLDRRHGHDTGKRSRLH